MKGMSSNIIERVNSELGVLPTKSDWPWSMLHLGAEILAVYTSQDSPELSRTEMFNNL